MNALLNDLRNATEFYRCVEASRQAGESVTETGTCRDAHEWLTSAALALGDELRRQHDGEPGDA